MRARTGLTAAAVVVVIAAAKHGASTAGLTDAVKSGGTHATVASKTVRLAPAAGIPAGSDQTLSCAQLERLWISAGGNPSAAFMAAEIARAESGGYEGSTDDDGDGSVDRGLWQVNSVHGGLSTYDPEANARSAVIISGNGTNWGPWVTYQRGMYQGQC